MMISILKQKLKELIREESGVAFAFTITVSLIIFLFGAAVYACGETVRQRIELQNAADSAAYSASLVQADTISRIAVINKAMSWNYVMMTRRQMDYIMSRWIERVTKSWDQSYEVTRNYQNICACHPRFEGANWRVGVSPGGGGGEVTHRLIRINSSQDVPIDLLRSVCQGNEARNPVSLLSSLRQCIASMNQAESELVSGMKKRMENAVEFAVNANLSLTENDKKMKNKRKIQWALHQLQDASVYFETLKNNEGRFFGFGNFPEKAQDVLGTGADTWMNLNSSDGFQRNYMQSGSTLSAYWFTYNQIWWHHKFCHFGGIVCRPCAVITAEMARDSYFTGQVAKPQVLKRNYFEKDGSIIVGVSRPQNNPLAFVYGGGSKGGIYSAFTVGGGNQTIWGVSSARAGYRLPDWKKGEYCNLTELSDRENLRLADWDAMFLPLRDAAPSDSSVLSGLAGKLDATSMFAGRNYASSYSNINFSNAVNLIRH